ncbi:molybdate ABC transporter substrate-binding protein [Oscillatoriales cyanobacterium LEGE 11467]|uniref:Molybdate ABC transporter substrate-binding protein n=1 Tax=Zarconia navalis LEGE 11467 TaxID=1828826 RepID=A0A928W035_9CYAN|nr:molybdate ABC transporter substrate-binding protein [Zarconia navalis]MBE9040830.1 molybdate ABC transporter substrate-binding protein [Zarconia navalis LEGE 11467]
MKKGFHFYLFCIFFSVVLLLTSCDRFNNDRSFQPSKSKVELTVSAASSLQEVMEAIKVLYIDEEDSNVEIVYNFGSSGSLQQQIEQGAPVDVFISAAAREMNRLQEKSLLLDRTRQDVLTNQIVLIVSKKNDAITRFEDLATAKVDRIALGQPDSVPAGKYAREVLIDRSLLAAVESKAIYSKNVRQVLGYVATNNVDAGIVYRTDAAISPQVKIVAIAPQDSHSPVVYPIAVLGNSSQVEAATDFVEFITGDRARTVFEKYGFSRGAIDSAEQMKTPA